MTPMDFEQARFNMVEQQIRPWEVLDQDVLNLLFTVKREDFVPAAYRAIAFTDMEIPLGHDQFMLAPKIEARILQEVAPKQAESALEVGTGSGYLTALLAKCTKHVTSIEYFDDLSQGAATRLRAAKIENVTLKVGDAAQSPDAFIEGEAKFDVIVLTGSVPVVPQAYLQRLNVGGRFFAVIGDAPVMKATLVTKTAEGQLVSADIFETVVPPLVNAAQPSRFDF
jgi:protein-L-isoaspartate(D-aspartate) O-methyltransferase